MLTLALPNLRNAAVVNAEMKNVGGRRTIRSDGGIVIHRDAALHPQSMSEFLGSLQPLTEPLRVGILAVDEVHLDNKLANTGNLLECDLVR